VGDWVLAQDVVEAGRDCVLELEELLVLVHFLHLDESHVGCLDIEEVSYAYSQDEMQSFNIFLAIEENFPD